MGCKACGEVEKVYRELSKKTGVIYVKYGCQIMDKKTFEEFQEKGVISKDANFKILE